MGELWITGNSLTTISCIKNYGKKINFSLISVGESISSVNPGLTQKLVGSEPVEKVAQSLTLRRAGKTVLTVFIPAHIYCVLTMCQILILWH